jgi:hypothetical protein
MTPGQGGTAGKTFDDGKLRPMRGDENGRMREKIGLFGLSAAAGP